MEFKSFSKEYLPLFHKWHNDKELNGKIGFDKPQLYQDTIDLVKSWVDDKNRILFMIEHNSAIIGYVTLSNINKDYEIADLHTLIGEKEYLGHKICVEVIDKILDYVFNVLNLFRVTTYVMGNNPKLINTARKYGWRQEGILRQVIKLNNQRIDYYVFGILKTEFRKRG